MGTDAMCQIGLMTGRTTAVVADLNADRAARAFELSGHSLDNIVFTNRAGVVDDARPLSGIPELAEAPV
jgi:hypothetical protein